MRLWASDRDGDTVTARHPVFVALAVLVCAVLTGLGVWQVQRLEWKTDLIARVEARVSAAPIAAPAPGDWATLTAAGDEYRRVTAQGRYSQDSDTLVQAVTARGAGFWVMTPLTTDDGWTVLVNRGFVLADRRDVRPLPDGLVTVTGLLRLTQPDGAFLRSNDPAADRWFSRDVAAIAQARGVAGAAPYFIDADAGGPGQPIGGLTVISFPNNHLQYALTWFAMAAGLAFLTVRALRRAG